MKISNCVNFFKNRLPDDSRGVQASITSLKKDYTD